MSSSKDWKEKLISSGLPLEFEAAQILVSKEFSIIADYLYARVDSNDSETVKDFSVDLNAVSVYAFPERKMGITHLELLVECKQRKPEIKWLFIPDPNPITESEISTRGMAIQAVDEFSINFFPMDEKNKLYSFIEETPVCYKGTEIDTSTGIVEDSRLRHGISQLQYALPRLLIQNIILCMNDTQFQDHHFVYCPILVTNAELYIANNKLKIKDIEKSSLLDQIAKKVPYLMFSSDVGPDFENHCIKESKKLADPSITTNLRKLELQRKSKNGFLKRSPLVICKDLMHADRYRLQEYFSQFIVCSMKDFPTLLEEIKKLTENVAGKITENNEIPNK